MLTILTKKPKENTLDFKYYLSEIKYFFKNKIQGVRGPQTVINNLLMGLDELGEKYLLDPNTNEITEDAKMCVIRDISALKFAIKFKKKNPKIKIFAGPNIITTPNEENYLIFDELIDKIIVPSQWVKDFYLTFQKSNESKIEIWPVGIKIPTKVSDKKGLGIIYKKNVPEEIFRTVVNELKRKEIKYKILEYGNFNQKEYFKFLQKAPWVVYLQKSESQGLAMFEAWSYDVPTLVWQNNKYNYLDKEYLFSQLSSPFLSSKAGLFFNSEDDFFIRFSSFLDTKHHFTPKEYVQNNFSTKLAAKNFLDIISR